MSASRSRMLGALRRFYGDEPRPGPVAGAPLEELWDIHGFGAAATYECRDWLAEADLRHAEIDDWVAAREGAGLGDPRKTREPNDYHYDAQNEKVPFLR